MRFALTRSCRDFTVTHVVIDSTKPFANVQAFLEATTPPYSQRTQASEGLVIFLKRDTLALTGQFELPREVLQYEIGSPRTLQYLMRLNAAAALYPPIRVLLYENQGGGSRFEYELPSSQLGRFGDDRITEIGRRMDLEIGRALSDAAE